VGRGEKEDKYLNGKDSPPGFNLPACNREGGGGILGQRGRGNTWGGGEASGCFALGLTVSEQW
jgi:hypothetical protein